MPMINVKIARALVNDFTNNHGNNDVIRFKDDGHVYTLEIRTAAVSWRESLDAKILPVSLGPAGEVCEYCGGSGRK